MANMVKHVLSRWYCICCNTLHIFIGWVFIATTCTQSIDYNNTCVPQELLAVLYVSHRDIVGGQKTRNQKQYISCHSAICKTSWIQNFIRDHAAVSLFNGMTYSWNCTGADIMTPLCYFTETCFINWKHCFFLTCRCLTVKTTGSDR